MNYRVLPAALFLSFLASQSIAGTNIDILLTFSDDTNMSLTEKTQLAVEVQAKIGLVYGLDIAGLTLPSQLLNDQTVRVRPLLADLSYEAADGSSGDALAWMKDENNKIPTSPLRLARDGLLGAPGADIVIMVVPSTTSPDCGAAFPIPLFATELHRENNAFAVVVAEDLEPDCDDDLSFPHEVGHVLYAEHEVVLDQGGSVTDTNGSIVAPDHRNHAIQSNQTSLKSLMWDGLEIDGSNTEWLSGHLGQMTGDDSNNVAFFSEISFDIVSNYRKPQEEEVTVFWLPLCFGDGAIYPSLQLALSSGGVSYQVNSGTGAPGIQVCFAIAVETSQ